MSQPRPALRAFCAAEYPRLVGALRLSCGHDPGLAEEFAQEAMARLCRDWSRVSQGQSPRAWLHRVALNLTKSYWRRQYLHGRVQAKVFDDPVQPDHAHDAVERDRLRTALLQLTERERTVVVLRQYLEFTVVEAAKAMEISDQAVRSLNHRAIKRLRKLLESEQFEGNPHVR